VKEKNGIQEPQFLYYKRTSETEGKTLRIDDYRFYGHLCLSFGVILLLIGIALPIFTMKTWWSYFGTQYSLPYLGHGIALAVVGIILIVVSQILYREYNFKVAEAKKTTPQIPPPPTPQLQTGSVGYCPYCGATIEKDAVYCRKCGKKLQ
jgi:hypothetical protein